MKITLSKEALGALPAPDSKGLVRVSATLELGPGGTVSLTQIDGQPVGEPADDTDAGDASSDTPPPATDDQNPMPAAPEVPDMKLY